MFVGETGLGRVIERTAQMMRERGVDHPDDVRKLGLIDLPTIQRYINLWYALSLDLFGGEISSNAASFFATGLKGRPKEAQYDEHVALTSVHTMDMFREGSFVREEVPLRNAMNEVLRDDYVIDCQRGLDKWNRVLASHEIPFTLTLPSRRFYRHIGIYAELFTDLKGQLISKEAFEAHRSEWLPSESDKAFVKSLMAQPVWDPKQMAHWIAAPKQGIKGHAVDFEYVRRCEG